MRNGTRLILLNITGCILFLALPLLFAPASSNLSDELTSPPTLKDLIAYSLLIGYFYLNFFVLIPKYYFKHRYVVFAFFTVVCFSLITALPNVFYPQQKNGAGPPPKSLNGINDTRDHKPPPRKSDRQPPAPPPGEAPNDISLLNHISHQLFLFLGVFFFSLLLKINNRWKKAEEEKLSTELSYLKAQVNPHFLFNTLNSIYSLALEKSDNTATAIVKLSAMMRYVLSEADKDFVPLEKELDYISSYIELQKIRYGSAMPFTYMVSGNIADKKIAPLILISFVENAFKHGVNAEENSAINIEIDVKENELHLTVINNKVQVQLAAEDKTGTGIGNVKNRLQLLYPGSHVLQIHDNETNFVADLKLNLQ
jgi:hypothetical protein